MTDIIFIIIGLILLILGIIGSFLPILPGPILAYLSLLSIQLSKNGNFSTKFIIIFLIIALLVSVLDNIIPILGTKKFGGSKYGIRGSTIGLIIALIILPILGITIGPFGILGIIIFPFLGAYIGEQLAKNKKPLKSAFGSFVGFLSGVFIKFALSVIIGIYFFKESISIIKIIF